MARMKIFVACAYTIFPLVDYKNCFKGVAEKSKVSFEFADDSFINQHILINVTNHIKNSYLSLFDITGWNPNVTLELGLALGLEKRHFILLNKHYNQDKNVPSDIQGIRRIEYASLFELEANLLLLIQQEMENYDLGRSGQDSEVSYVVEGSAAPKTLVTQQKREIERSPRRSSQSFDSFKKDVTDAIKLNPGLGIGKLAKILGKEKTLIQSTLRVLLESGDLKKIGERRGTIYYPKNTDLRTVRYKAK